jgi:hypothetical protein
MWRFILTDKNFVPVGEVLNAYSRKVVLPLNKLATSSFRVRLDNPLADDLLNCKGYIKAYRAGELEFFGPVISAEEAADANTQGVAVNCVDQGWIFQKRIVGKSTLGTAFTNQDRATIVRDLIVAANAENDTHISTSALGISAASAVTYTAGPYITLMETLTTLATGVDSFDWRVRPLDNFSNGGVTGSKIGAFQAAPVIGSQMPNAIFEYGFGKNNMQGYSRQVTRDTAANKFYHMTSAGPSSVMSAIDTDSISDLGLLEALVQADLVDATMRTQLLNEHKRVRRQPRSVVTFTPHIDPRGVRVPQFGQDFDLGDQVRGRAVVAGRVRFDGWFRVWGVDFTIEDNGLERPNLILEEDSA